MFKNNKFSENVRKGLSSFAGKCMNVVKSPRFGMMVALLLMVTISVSAQSYEAGTKALTCEVRAYRRETLLCHCRCGCRRRFHRCLH